MNRPLEIILRFLCFACCALGGVGNASAEAPRGPIRMADQHPLALLHASHSPDSAATLTHGEYELRTSFAWSNTLNRRKGVYLFDAESRMAALEGRYGVSNDVDLSLIVPVVWRGRGVLDPLIDDWHKLLGLPRGKRDKVDDNGFSLAGENDDDSTFSLTDNGTSLGSVELGSKWLMVRGIDGAPSWALSGLVSLPTARGSFGHESVDLGMQLLGSWAWEELNTSWGGGYIFYCDEERDNLRYQRHRFSGFGAVEYPLIGGVSLHLGVLAANGFLKDVKKYPNYQVYLDTGLSYALGNSVILELLVRENPGPRDGTVDISGLFAVRLR